MRKSATFFDARIPFSIKGGGKRGKKTASPSLFRSPFGGGKGNRGLFLSLPFTAEKNH